MPLDTFDDLEALVILDEKLHSQQFSFERISIVSRRILFFPFIFIKKNNIDFPGRILTVGFSAKIKEVELLSSSTSG